MSDMMAKRAPKAVILAGANGSGKSTSAPKLLLGALRVQEFVNADTIAQGLSAFAQESVAFEAGRIMLKRIKELGRAHLDFGFETTLATRSYAPWLKRLRADGYQVHIVYLWLSSADEAVARVTARVRAGGHNVPEDTIRRRYRAGLRNLFHLYMPIADSWQLIDNSMSGQSGRIAAGGQLGAVQIDQSSIWQTIQNRAQEP